MFDIRWIRDNAAAFDAGMARRGLGPQSGALLELDGERRGIQTKLQELQARRNAASKAIGTAKAKGEDATSLIEEVTSLKDALRESESLERDIVTKLEAALAGLPNTPADDVPSGDDEESNVEVRRWGERPGLDFAPKEHFELGETLGLMDFDVGARISGARFVVLKGALARLDRALGAFMLDMMTTEHGYTEVVPPLLVRDEAVFGTGQLPKFSDDLFKATRLDRDDLLETVSAGLRAWANELLDHDVNPLSGEAQNEALRKHVDNVQVEYQKRIDGALESGDYEERYWLIPTAEVPLTNLVRDQILKEPDLPLRVTALTPCFRSEAGAAGKDTRGMIRQHQFNKVEIVSVVHPDQSAGGARAVDGLRGGSFEAARIALSSRRPMHGRPRVLGAQDLRYRSLAPGAGTLPRNFELLQFWGISGAADGRALRSGWRKGDALCPHPERVGSRGRPHPHRGIRELSAGRWFDRCSRRAAALYGRA